MVLPPVIGTWRGETVSYCHNESCQQEQLSEAGSLPEACRACGGPLQPISLAEKRALPGDTRFARMLYRRGNSESAFVSIVVTGSDRSSIHRPEWCLPAQGYKIRQSRLEHLNTPHGAMAISYLDVTQGQASQAEDAYLYWFSSGNGHHTPRHSTRHFWMALDSLIDGKQHRWAFISVLMHVRHPERQQEMALRFAKELTRTLYQDSGHEAPSTPSGVQNRP
jgi:hypothetical protein